MNEKRIAGLTKSTPGKRYKSFLTTAADTEEIWLLKSAEGDVYIESDGRRCVPIWPGKEFCEPFTAEESQSYAIDVHDFLAAPGQENLFFAVFPTETNSFIADGKRLIADIQEELDRVE